MADTDQNPYESSNGFKLFDRKTGEPVVESLRPEGGGNRIFAKTGDHYEINAVSKRDLMLRTAQIHNALKTGAITRVDPEEQKRRFAAFKQAYDDAGRDPTAFHALGEVMSDEILNLFPGSASREARSIN